MPPNSASWLGRLQEQAQAVKLPHLDLLINATQLDYPLLRRLAALSVPPLQAQLFAGTAEHALAAQGPILLRLHWQQLEQQAWLSEFVRRYHRDHRVLALLSAWPFDELAQHLRHCTQAQWNQGADSGLLRFYEPRLLRAVCEMLDPVQSAWFHAPIVTWHWLDRDGKAAVLPGNPVRASELARPLPALRLSHPQVAYLLAWSAAEALRREHALVPQDYALAQQETLMRHLVHGQLAADREGLNGQEREPFIFDWLAANSAMAPSTTGIPT